MLSESEWEYVARAGTGTRYWWGTRLAGTGRTAMDAGAGGMVVGRRRWVRSLRMRLVCMTCMGTYGSRWRTAGTGVITERWRTGVHGCRGIAAGGCCAAAPGAAYRGTSAPPTATGSPPASGTSMPASVLPGRSRHESFPLYLRGAQEQSPLADFFRLRRAVRAPGSVCRRSRRRPVPAGRALPAGT